MKRTSKADDHCPVKVKGLRLKRHAASTWIDQYGRVLELYRDSEGKQDLRPVGISSANH